MRPMEIRAPDLSHCPWPKGRAFVGHDEIGAAGRQVDFGCYVAPLYRWRMAIRSAKRAGFGTPPVVRPVWRARGHALDL